MKFLKNFLFLRVIFPLLDPNPDSESGSTDLIKSGSNPDPDPKHCKVLPTISYLALCAGLARFRDARWKGEAALHAGAHGPTVGGGAAETLLGCARGLVVSARLIHEDVGVPVALPFLWQLAALLLLRLKHISVVFLIDL
jgi:hypothetical protein